MVHAACAIAQIDWGLSLGSLWIANAATPAPIVRDGMVQCPLGAGLGITVDERRIRALAP
jgi:muconate cycloisomerase